MAEVSKQVSGDPFPNRLRTEVQKAKEESMYTSTNVWDFLMMLAVCGTIVVIFWIVCYYALGR